MTSPLSPEARVELVAKAKAAFEAYLKEVDDARYYSQSRDPSPPSEWHCRTLLTGLADAEATVVALTEERDAALERVKALEADKKHLRDTLMGARDVCLNGLALLTPKDPGHG